MAETQIDPMEALKAILSQLNANQTEQLKEFAKELKKPTDREQAKLDAEEKQIQRHQAERLQLAQAEEEAKTNQRRNCGHVRYHPLSGTGGHLWRAQVHTPRGVAPYFVPTCLGCNDQVGKIPATPDMMREGVSLQNYPGLTREALEKWALQYKA